jgi:ectoine hydroxylase-related dioxygenase (phytanoyl-CoA dioxygenase family)
VGKGAKRIEDGGNGTSIISDDETGVDYPVPFDLNDLAISPEVAVGDLLILRGDIFHKTQDTNTNRVAMSVRATHSSTVMKKDVFYSGCAKKRAIIQNDISSYQRLIDRFNTVDQCVVADIHDV